MKASIRPATMGDYEAICELYRIGDQEHANGMPGRFRVCDPARSREFIEGWLQRDDAAFFLAETAGQVVGLVQCCVVETPDRSFSSRRTFLSVDGLVVREESRRNGIGRALMECAEEWAVGRGVNEVELNVYEFNEGAIRLYEQLGYRTFSRRMGRRLQ